MQFEINSMPTTFGICVTKLLVVPAWTERMYDTNETEIERREGKGEWEPI